MAEPAPAPLELDAKYDDYDFPTSAPAPVNGHPGFLTSQQQAQVHQLRLLLETEGFTERLDTLTLVRLAHTPDTVGGLLTQGTAAFPARSQVRCGACQTDVRESGEGDIGRGILTDSRFIDTEKWRKDIKLDETVPNWDYPEKAEVFKYYPQYYHKTDKVWIAHALIS